MLFPVLSKLCVVLFVFSAFAPLTLQASTAANAAALPEQIGDFRAQSPVRSLKTFENVLDGARLEEFKTSSVSTRTYVLPDDAPYIVTIVNTQSDAGAYALFTHLRERMRREASSFVRLEAVGTVGVAAQDAVLFYKGPTFVRINGGNPQRLVELARIISASLDEGGGEVPVLVKHLPAPASAQERAVYAVTLSTLQEATGNRPVLDAVSFNGGAEAVAALYEQATRLVIVEHATPQLATDNDTRITGRLEELRRLGQPLPSVYRRIGNYAVFVFDAVDEAAANRLADGVRYEQVVQWLGDNPHALENAQRAYGAMTANVLLTTMKAIGLAGVACLCIGVIFGSFVFMRRRAQGITNQTYSDAGGMVRLQLDDVVVTTKQLAQGHQRNGS